MNDDKNCKPVKSSEDDHLTNLLEMIDKTIAL